MTTVLLRVWLPDRPGALGEVASAIGLAGGDVVGIEILERGGGRAIDELVVSLPEGVDVNALVARVSAVAGADIEDVRPVDDDEHDLGMAAVELAADLAEASDRAVVLARLTHAVHTTLAADWAVIAASGGVLSEVVGDAPSAPWLSAYLEGVRHVAGAGAGHGADDVAWAELPGAGLDVVVGRSGRPLRDRERRFLRALARVSAVRWSDLGARRRTA